MPATAMQTPIPETPVPIPQVPSGVAHAQPAPAPQPELSQPPIDLNLGQTLPAEADDDGDDELPTAPAAIDTPKKTRKPRTLLPKPALADMGAIFAAQRQRDKNSELTPVMRAAICGAVYAGASHRTAASAFQISVGAVQSTLKRFRDTQGFESLPRPGQPRKIDARTAEVLSHVSATSPGMSYRDMAVQYGAGASRSTVHRYLRKIKARQADDEAHNGPAGPGQSSFQIALPEETVQEQMPGVHQPLPPAGPHAP